MTNMNHFENTILKIGIIVKDIEIPHWQYYIIEEINKSHFATISNLIISSGTNDFSPKFTFIDNIFKNIFEKIESNRQLGEDDSQKIKKLEIDPSLKITNINSASSTSKIKDENLDLIINLSSEKLSDLSNASKYGLWSIHHGPNPYELNQPLGFWEILKCQNVTNSLLLFYYPPGRCQIIDKSYVRTNILSPKRTQNLIYWKTCSLILNNLKIFYILGPSRFEQLSNHNVEFSNEIKINFPHFKDYYEVISIMKKRHSRAKSISKNLEQWILLYNFGNSLSTEFHKFKEIRPPEDRFWADPFVLFRDNTYFVFFEEFIYGDKGNISYLTIDENEVISEPKRILEESYHMSYPYIFEYDNSIFMIPETHSNKTIDLYECIEFPSKWKFKKNLIKDIDAVDSTPLFFDNKWWIFTSVKTNPYLENWDDLFLFYSDDILSDNFISHPINPVVSDIQKSRSAGKIFFSQNKILRPSQNSSISYGGSISLNEINVLTPDDFKEKKIKSFLPWSEKIVGIHTINHTNKLSIIDAKYLKSC
ncbi:MAG: hypothetical protein DWQ18_09425 [Crenarchaeota archaeon]|nr:MAG: hypothetical protein DWQ17_00360 [Thermoproteota archaeon]RDJ33347.1 MAG: hypothetical protein DWQ18_09425 [Thermoproteota archaeon]RDJ36149.1 MAG: hypothetical protein DWQ19_05895 [Thermoproteota archaeon]RDJ38781.1 MAG: hypothetical protein DWQ13_00360 [Thermoproteota archaeon]